MKAQSVRLLDVFLLGPLMAWAGWKLLEEHPVAGSVLGVSGVGTVLYNGRNYLRVRGGNQLIGGMADKQAARSFDLRQLRAGMRVEMEHTNDPNIAREIAMDHLTEDPRYYDKLAKAGL